VLRERVEALERQLDSERRQRAAEADDERERRRRAYDECVRARGTDCDAMAELPIGIAPAVVYVPARRAHIVPTLPVLPHDARNGRRLRHPAQPDGIAITPAPRAAIMRPHPGAQRPAR
jgi:hypothetical protein